MLVYKPKQNSKQPGMWKRKRWKRSFFCGSGSVKIL